MAPHHPQSDHQADHRRTRAGQHAGWHPSRTHLLPAPGNQHRQPGTGILTHLNCPPGLAWAGCEDNPQVRFWGERGAATRPAYPTGELRLGPLRQPCPSGWAAASRTARCGRRSRPQWRPWWMRSVSPMGRRPTGRNADQQGVR